MNLEIKPKQYRRDKKQDVWQQGKAFKSILDSAEQNSQPYTYTFEFDKFLCVAFNIDRTLLDKKDIVVHIEDRNMLLYVKNVKEVLNTKNSRTKVGFNYKTGNDIFLEFIDGYIQLECLKTNENDLKKAIKLVEYKLCKN